jgi:hypothetical protein
VPYLNGRADAISNRGWSREFDDPIVLTDGRVLRTLLDAGNYVVALSPKAKKLPEWQAAAEALVMAAEGRGSLMHAHSVVRYQPSWHPA